MLKFCLQKLIYKYSLWFPAKNPKLFICATFNKNLVVKTIIDIYPFRRYFYILMKVRCRETKRPDTHPQHLKQVNFNLPRKTTKYLTVASFEMKSITAVNMIWNPIMAKHSKMIDCLRLNKAKFTIWKYLISTIVEAKNRICSHQFLYRCYDNHNSVLIQVLKFH